MSQPKPRRATPAVVLPSGVKLVALAAVDGCWGVVMSFERRLLEREWAVVVEQLVEQRLGESANVLRRGEDAGLPGDSAHAAGGRIIHRPRRK